MNDLSILLLGDTSQAEFRHARRVLDGLGRVRHAADAAAAAVGLAEDQETPDVIVVAQAYPGQFPRAAVDGLRPLAPLARVVALLGSWCEGEMRSGRPWPGTIRLYWHQWTPRVSRQLQRLVAGRESLWDLPPTTTEEERLLSASRTPWPQCRGLVAIATPRAEMEAWLAAACRASGWATAWLREAEPLRVEGASAAIFDAADGDHWELDRMGRLAAALAPAPVVALADFPRIEDAERLRAAGASAVLSKPLHVDDLVWALGASGTDFQL